MHPVDLFILFSIGQVVSWLATLYVETDPRRLLGHAVVATLGAFLGGYVATLLFPPTAKLALIGGGFLGAIVLLVVLRFRKARACAGCGRMATLATPRCPGCAMPWPALHAANEQTCRRCGAVAPLVSADPGRPGAYARVVACPSCGKPNPSAPDWAGALAGRKLASIAGALAVVGALFLLLAWAKSLQIMAG
ncbi:MAG: hypothetical protein H6907_18680 [Hyphomicrobiales bacterium]|nr:hypothetical protein [Hyphomicrobiales bacterium]